MDNFEIKGQRRVALAMLGCLVFNYPILESFNRPGTVLGIPVLYAIFKTLTSPAMKVTRWITPRIVLDRRIWLTALFLQIVLCIGLTIMKISIVLQNTPPAS